MNPMKMIREMRSIGRLLADAERVARRLGEEEPAAEHLLIAALELPEGSAARALGRVGVRAEDLERAIVAEHRDGLVAAGVDPASADLLARPLPLEPGPPRGVYRSSPSARELFQAAGAEARGAREPLRGAHVVLAAAAIEEGTLARALRRLGIDPSAMRDAARAEQGR